MDVIINSFDNFKCRNYTGSMDIRSHSKFLNKLPNTEIIMDLRDTCTSL